MKRYRVITEGITLPGGKIVEIGALELNKDRTFIPVLANGDFHSIVGKAHSLERDEENNVTLEIEFEDPDLTALMEDENNKYHYDLSIVITGVVMVHNTVKYGIIGAVYLLPLPFFPKHLRR